MPGLKLQVTNAGRAALINAPNTGTNAVLVSQVGIANTPFAASAALTALPSEIKRIDTVGGTITAADTVHVSVRDETTDVYDCYGFGLYLSDGTLFAVYSQPTLLLGKAAAAMMLLALDAVFTDIDVTQLTFGDTNFTDPAATTEVPGVVELATETEATSGTDKVRAITAFLLKKVLDSRFGAGAPSEFVKGLLGLGTAALLRTALELKGAALKDEGDGKGLDADKLDGKHASDFAAVTHGHAISAIAGLADALAATWNNSNFDPNSKYDKAGGQVSGQVLINLGPLGTAQGDTNTNLILRNTSANLDFLEAQIYRQTAGSSWDTAAYRIRRRVDSTVQGFVDFPGSASGKVLSFGSGATERGYLGVDGRWVFLTNAAFGGWASAVGTIHGDSTGAGQVAAFQIGNDCSLWDINVSGSACLQSVSDSTKGVLYFGSDKQVWYGVHPTNTGGSTQGVKSQHQINVANGGFYYQYYDTQHVATYKRAGGYSFYWRKNATGAPGGAGEVELMSVNDAGKLWTLSGYGWGSSRKLKDVIGASPYGLAEVEQLQVNIGRYKRSYNPDGRVRLFLDAEQLLELMPETVDAEGVSFNGEMVPGVQFDQLLPVAFNAIKQLSHRLRDLQAEVADLRDALT